MATPVNQEGPTEAPPQLPEGCKLHLWKHFVQSARINNVPGLAQWEGNSRKYYYVQRATGHSQWDVPTEPALSVPTPDPTPRPDVNPFPHPDAGPRSPEMGPDSQVIVRNADGTVQHVDGNDRSLLGVCSFVTIKILLADDDSGSHNQRNLRQTQTGQAVRLGRTCQFVPWRRFAWLELTQHWWRFRRWGWSPRR